MGAKYPMYPTSTNTPAGCSGNRQSRSIGEDGDTAGDGTPRVPLYMDRNSFTCTFRYFKCPTYHTIVREDMQISPPHAISFCCYGGWRYGRHRAGEKPAGVIRAYGI
jgi:hypothetical protein